MSGGKVAVMDGFPVPLKALGIFVLAIPTAAFEWRPVGGAR